MTVVTLRPSSTAANTGALVGAATAHAALNDDSDASYLEYDSGELSDLDFDDLTLPAGAVIKSLGVRARTAHVGVGSRTLNAFIESHLGVYSSFVSWHVAPVTITLPHVSGTGSALPGTDAGIDAAVVTFMNVGGGTGGAVRVYEGYLDVTYVALPVVAVTAPTGTVTDTNQPTVVWSDTLDSDGGPQTYYQVRVFTDAQYGAGGFDPATSTATTEIGSSAGYPAGADSSWQVAAILPNDTYRAYVRVAQTVNGAAHWSAFAYSEFTINVALPAVPTLTLTPDNANGRIRVQAADNTGTATTDYLFLERSLDSGTTWTPVRLAATDPDPLTPDADVYDYEAPNGATMQYRARAAHSYTGVLAYSAWTTGSASWSSNDWWLKHPNQPELNMTVRVRSFKTVQRAGRQGVLQPLGATVPVVVSDTRESTKGSVTVRLDSTSEQDAVDALLDTVGTLLLQSPAGGGGPGYIRVTDHERERAIDWHDATPSFDTLAFVVVASNDALASLWPEEALYPA